jgi:phosphoesterase RecJ-like protein
MTNLYELAQYLEAHDNYEILTHAYPDGDTLGSGYALCLALQQKGKKARVITTNVPTIFNYLLKGVEEQNFKTETIISTDVAADCLLGSNTEKYSGKIDVCIDHHGSNTITAKEKLVDSSAAANCEIIYKLLQHMNVKITQEIADCLYTGISTDTGCFRYTNTTAETMRVAASLMDFGCSTAYINKVMFETKSKAKILIEHAVYDTITYCANEKCAIICTTCDMLKNLGIGDDELEGLASIPRQIEGVLIGITMREKTSEKEGTFFKISVRTNDNINASDFCKKFGGGGHPAAAGCKIKGSLEDVKAKLIKAAEETLK